MAEPVVVPGSERGTGALAGAPAASAASQGQFKLSPGSRVGVIGGGPAGSFFSYFLLQNSRLLGLDLEVDIYEQRDFRNLGAQGCNMCGGIVSESLVQHLATEGIHIPKEVIRRRIDSYFLHMDVGSIRIETPRQEKRIAAVHRGGGPRGSATASIASFDAYLLDMARAQGARWVREKVERFDRCPDGRPRLETKGGHHETYDLVAMAIGVNGPSARLFKDAGVRRAPATTKTYICEFFLGVELLRRYLGSSMHVFLLDLPRLEFAALIPKEDYVTVVLLGADIDKPLIDRFLGSRQVREVMPPHWKPPADFCRCAPRINVAATRPPYTDRCLFIGDCGTTRLYKDGIGAAYRTAKAAASAAAFYGVGVGDFERHYLPACRAIARDNLLGEAVFGVTRIIKKLRIAQTGVWRMLAREQRQEGAVRRMSGVMWDTFTGSAPYRSVLKRTLNPGFLSRLVWETAAGAMPERGARGNGGVVVPTGMIGKKYQDGETVYRQGEMGDCMYVVVEGKVELLRREGEREFCLATFEPGDFFGEGAIVRQERRSMTARSLGVSTILTVEKSNFLRRMQEDPSLSLRLVEKLSKRIGALEEALILRGSEMPVG